MKKKTLIILNGNQEAFQGIKVLRKLYNIVLVDLNQNCASRKLVKNFIKADIYKPKKVLSEVKKYFKKKKRPDGSLVLSCDAVLSMAYINDYYKLNGVNVKIAEKTNNKISLKKFFKKNKIYSSRFWVVSKTNHIQKILNKNKDKKFILKPAVGRGARGVMFINELDFKKNFNICKSYAKKNKILMEEFINGPQISAEAIVCNKILHLCGISDRNYDKLNLTYPYIVEDGGETPSKYSHLLKNKIKTLFLKISNLLKFYNGTIKADLVLNNGKIYVVEIALRLSGGDYSTITIPEVYKINIINNAAKVALGEKLKITNAKLKSFKYQSNRFLFLGDGVVKKIDNLKINLLRKNKLIKKIDLNLKMRQKLSVPKNHPDRHGSVMVVTNNKNKSTFLVIETVKKILKLISLKKR